MERLADEGLLAVPETKSPQIEGEDETVDHAKAAEGREVQGAPWFEEMIEGSELGRIKRRKGGKSSSDGRSKVEWEVVEFSSEPGDTGGSTAKRKLDQVGNENHDTMKE